MRYTRTAMSLHWLIALMLFGMFGFGLYMVELPLSPQKLKFYSYHKWAGVTVFLLVLARLAWRITHRPPALPAGMPACRSVILVLPSCSSNVTVTSVSGGQSPSMP